MGLRSRVVVRDGKYWNSRVTRRRGESRRVPGGLNPLNLGNGVAHRGLVVAVGKLPAGGGGGSRTRVRESLPPEAYVRSRFGEFGHRVGTGKPCDGLVRLLSAFGSGPKPAAQPALITPLRQPAGLLARTAASQSGSVGKLRVGSFCSPIVLRELGTRHAFRPQDQSRRIRYAPFPLPLYGVPRPWVTGKSPAAGCGATALL
jgi:hypothetical protein